MILSIQYMRAIASLLVLLHHISWKSEQYSTDILYWYTFGEIGIDIFFIISGYIMVFIGETKEKNIKIFLKSRLIRVLPLYWTLTILALIVYLYSPGSVNSSGGSTDILYSFLLIPGEHKFLIQNGWTLSYEFYFYIIFSFSLLFTSIYKSYIPLFIMLLLVLYGILSNDNSFIYSTRLLEFSVGIIIYKIHQNYVINKVLSIIILMLSIFLLVFLDTKINIIDYGIPASLFFIAMIYLEDFFVKYKYNSISYFFTRIGESSYSLYLIHVFALAAISKILNSEMMKEYPYFYIIILFISSIIIGHICYLYLEKKLDKGIKKYLK